MDNIGKISKTSAELYKLGQHKDALDGYYKLKNLTSSNAWDWNIRDLEIKLELKRSTFFNKELGKFLINIAKIDRIYILNLSHRTDRKKRTQIELSKFGINDDIVSYIDSVNGYTSELAADLYTKFQIANPVNFLTLKDVPHDVVEYDQTHVTKGDIGYLLTQEIVFNDVLNNNYKRFLVFDDDFFFTAKATSIVYNFFCNCSEWQIVNFGASEHSSRTSAEYEYLIKFSGKKNFYHPIPYKTCGSFAIAYDSIIVPEILSLLVEYVGIYDRTILGHFYRTKPEMCFTIKPEACCANVTESDIREPRNMHLHAEKMGWDISRFNEYNEGRI